MDESSRSAAGPVEARLVPHQVELEQARNRLKARMFGQASKAIELGHYRIERRLGAGGMGVVYEGLDLRLQRRVALKFLTSDRVRDPQAQRRFRSEAQIMARLSHPNVVEVFDVGDVRGLLFIAMELVDGENLAQWLARQPRTIDEVVHAFMAAGRGIVAAHRAGIVHRDFKPHNVLVGADGRVRVTDFGLARLASSSGVTTGGESRRNAGMRASTGGRSGTARYMAPEQSMGRPVDARADQYSFCVALEECLRDRLLHHPTSDRTRGAAAVPRAIAMVLERGLQPDPAQRFADFEALLDALGRPRRRWPRFAAGALGLAAVALATVRQETPPSCAVERRLSELWSAERRSQVLAAVASDEPTATDPGQRVATEVDRLTRGWSAAATVACRSTAGSDGPTPHDETMACLQTRATQLDALLSLLMHDDEVDLDRVQYWLARQPAAASCPEGLPDFSPSSASETAEERAVRELAARANALGIAGRFEEGVRVAASAVEQAQTIERAHPRIDGMVAHGRLLLHAGEYDAADEVIEEATAAAIAEREDELAATSSVTAVLLALRRGDLDQARDRIKFAEAALERAGIEGDLRATLTSYTAMVEGMSGNLARAITLHGETVTAWQQQSGAHAELRVADSLANQADALASAGRLDEAEAGYQGALDIYRARLGDDHPAAARALGGLAATMVRGNRFAPAIPLLERVLEIREARLGPDHPFVATTLNSWAWALSMQGHHDAAIAHNQRALSIRTAAHGELHPDTAIAMGNLAEVLANGGYRSRARKHQRRALEIREQVLDPRHAHVASSLASLGALAAADGEHERALALYERALDILEDKPEANRQRMLGVVGPMASVLYELGRPAIADRRAEEALALVEQLPVAESAAATPHLTLARIRRDAGESADAVRHAQKAYELRRDAKLDPALLGEARWVWAQAEWDDEQRRSARDLATAALEDYRRAQDDEHIARIQRWLDDRPTRGAP